MPKSNAEHQAEYKARQLNQGRVRRPYYATPNEHEKLKQLLKKLRGEL